MPLPRLPLLLPLLLLALLPPTPTAVSPVYEFIDRDVLYPAPGTLGLELETDLSVRAVTLNRGADRILPGDRLLRVNAGSVEGLALGDAVAKIIAAGRPLTLTFRRREVVKAAVSEAKAARAAAKAAAELALEAERDPRGYRQRQRQLQRGGGGGGAAHGKGHGNHVHLFGGGDVVRSFTFTAAGFGGGVHCDLKRLGLMPSPDACRVEDFSFAYLERVRRRMAARRRRSVGGGVGGVGGMGGMGEGGDGQHRDEEEHEEDEEEEEFVAGFDGEQGEWLSAGSGDGAVSGAVGGTANGGVGGGVGGEVDGVGGGAGRAGRRRGDGGALGMVYDRVVLARRGGCSFIQKAHVAQLAGAAALVIVNDENTTFVMDHSGDISQGSLLYQVDIPVGMVSQAAGATLRDTFLASLRRDGGGGGGGPGTFIERRQQQAGVWVELEDARQRCRGHPPARLPFDPSRANPVAVPFSSPAAAAARR